MRQKAIWTIMLFVATLVASCDNKKASTGSGAAAACTARKTEADCRTDVKCGWDYNSLACKNASDLTTTSTPTSTKECRSLSVAECSTEYLRCQLLGTSPNQYCDTKNSTGLNCSIGVPPSCPAGCVPAPATVPGMASTQCVDPALAGGGSYYPPGGYIPYPTPPSVMPQVLLGGALGALGGLLGGGGIAGIFGGLAKGALGALSGGAGTLPYGPTPYGPTPSYSPYATPPTGTNCSMYPAVAGQCPPAGSTVRCMISGSMCVAY